VAALLLVEDDPTIGESLRDSLAAEGHDARWVTTAADALAVAGATAYALVLLDLGLPDLDGVEVARRLRALQPACVIVMLTARRDEVDVVVGLEAGADDYLTPVHARAPGRLRSPVQARVGRSQTSRLVRTPLRRVDHGLSGTTRRRVCPKAHDQLSSYQLESDRLVS
jgi:DNA-binding response OmpR family regulator